MNVRVKEVDIEKLLIGMGTSISDKSHAENEKMKKKKESLLMIQGKVGSANPGLENCGKLAV